jgi:hypothetical protein
MSIPLESDVMAEIGLGASYNWYNGSGSCRSIRQSAVRHLEPVLRKFHEKFPDEIAAPDLKIIKIAQTVCDREESEYVLTRTWQVCSDIIRSHMEAPLSQDINFMDKRYKVLMKNYVGDISDDYLYGYDEGWGGYIVARRRRPR